MSFGHTFQLRLWHFVILRFSVMAFGDAFWLWLSVIPFGDAFRLWAFGGAFDTLN